MRPVFEGLNNLDSLGDLYYYNKENGGYMKQWIRLGLIVFCSSALVQAEVVTFDSSDGYKDGMSLKSGDKLLPGENFVYKRAGGTSSNVIENQSLKIYGGPTTFSTAWVCDAKPTAYGDVPERWTRSIDVKWAEGETVPGVDGTISVSLGNGAVLKGTDKIEVTTPNSYVLRVNFLVSSTTGTGLLTFHRYAAVSGTDTSQGYNFKSKRWGKADYCSYDITHTINVAYVYDSAAKQFSVVVHDVTADSDLLNLTLAESELASFSGGANTMLFAAGDIWQNSSKGTVAYLDNILGECK
jgi:hypothetical protein